MARTDRVVKLEFPTLSSTSVIDVRKLLVNGNAITNVYSHATPRASAQYFVEYATESDIPRTLGKFTVCGITVVLHALSESQTLRDEFDTMVVSEGTLKRKSPWAVDAGHATKKLATELDNASAGPSNTHNAFVTHSSVTSSSANMSVAELPPTPAPSPSTFLHVLKSGDIHIPTRKRTNEHEPERARQPPSPLSPLSIASPHSDPQSLPALATVPAEAAPSSFPTLSPSSKILLKLCGEKITYDLEGLDHDPAGIVKLLQATMAPPGAWMTVAAQYRRLQNPRSAVTVTTALVKMMTDDGARQPDMKPAYLLLSSCEHDLSRHAGPNDPSAVEHSNNAAKWLRCVYGALGSTGPDPPATNTLGLMRSFTAAAPALPDATVLHGPARMPYTQRLEDDLAAEQARRRQAERRLDDAEARAEGARRSEQAALAHVRREVVARRAAEDKAHEEKERRLWTQSAMEHEARALASDA
ncbi:hypothetical protein PLICRDRAFT_695614 [Plicaturopsis crispa FD-325 SS-3]|nr:hypothetical protein PLICRDRAFT_695614 [Plicaturopsis crispa FD-325 SS-3]